jgi:GNAT superfamily N-acetyltransferase
MTLALRDIEPDDVPFLQEMLYEALFWTPEKERWPAEIALAHPHVVVFHENWGRDGDTGYIAEVDGSRVGAAWYRLFTEAAHGEGFIDEETPEIAIAVVPEHRDRGIGKNLMLALAIRAKDDGFARLSLSVEPCNTAKDLYRSLGWVELEPDDPLGRMTLTL